MVATVESLKPVGQKDAPRQGSSPSITGRCMLANGDEFPCTAQSITPLGANILMKGAPPKNTVVICYLDNIGILRGVVRETGKDVFRLVFDMSDTRRARVAARIEWHEARATESAEQRACPRIVPARRETEIRLGENIVHKATIVDLSMSGVALKLDERFVPFVGSLIRIGKRYATVVRMIEGGFAAEFKLPFNRETFGPHVVL